MFITLGYAAFQPALFTYESRVYSTFRVANNNHCHGLPTSGHYKSRIGLCELTVDSTQTFALPAECRILNLPQVSINDPTLLLHPDYSGLEDARPFVLNGRLHLAGTMNFVRRPGGLVSLEYQRIAVARVDESLSTIERVNLIEMDFIPDVLKQKNWMPWVHNNTLFFIQQFAPYVLVKVDPASMKAQPHPTGRQTPFAGHYRGSSRVIATPYGYLGLLHGQSKYMYGPLYSHYLALFETPDSAPIWVSKGFRYVFYRRGGLCLFSNSFHR